MSATQLPSSLIVAGGQVSVTGYIVVRSTPTYEVKEKDIPDADGVTYTKLVKQRAPGYELELISLAAGAPETAFPKGKMCTVASWTDYYVVECKTDNTEDEERTTVTLIKPFTNDA